MVETEITMSLELQGELNLEGSLEADEMYLRGPQGPQGESGPQGPQGEDGVSIESVIQTIKSIEDDGINVITVTKTNGETSTFEIKNGGKGSKGDPGEKGDTGNSGVYTGPDEPTDPEIKVWIDVSNEEVAGIAEESVF